MINVKKGPMHLHSCPVACYIEISLKLTDNGINQITTV
jgi:hypothetical protein